MKRRILRGWIYKCELKYRVWWKFFEAELPSACIVCGVCKPVRIKLTAEIE